MEKYEKRAKTKHLFSQALIFTSTKEACLAACLNEVGLPSFSLNEVGLPFQFQQSLQSSFSLNPKFNPYDDNGDYYR